MTTSYEEDARRFGEQLFQLGRYSGVEESGVQGENAEKQIAWCRSQANDLISTLADDGARLDYLERDSNART